LTGAFPLALADRRQANSAADTGKIVMAIVLFAIVIVIQFALCVMSRYAPDALQDARLTLARNTFTAAKTFLPFGSGIGSFVQVYGMFEKPSDIFVDSFANHAHNDFLEFFLETGLIGAAFAVAFLVWLTFSAARAWQRTARLTGSIDRSLARAASIVIVLLLLHSFVDYPLRTNAIMAIFAFSCAMLVRPLTIEQTAIGGEEEQQVARHQTREGAFSFAGRKPRHSRLTVPALDRGPDPNQPDSGVKTLNGRTLGADRPGADKILSSTLAARRRLGEGHDAEKSARSKINFFQFSDDYRSPN
jgi:hypothetical protein